MDNSYPFSIFLCTVGLFCGLELDEYGRLDRKARTRPANTDLTTLNTVWDHDFELEIVGAHIIKVVIFSKYLLKEEVFATGKIKVRTPEPVVNIFRPC